MNLYTINANLQRLLSDAQTYAEEHEGELPNDLAAQIESVELSKEEKLENCLRYAKNERALSEMVSAEIDALKKRTARHERNYEWMKSLIAANTTPGQKIEYASGVISWRKSTATEITDAQLIPTEFTFTETHIKKREIGDALKGGVEVPGAKLVQNINLQLK